MSIPDQALRGRAALVTGGGSGIGLACAAALVRDGAVVTIAGRDADKLARAAATLAAGGGDAAERVRQVVCDVTDEASVAAAVAAAAEPLGGLHAAVANAGAGAGGPLFSTDVAAWRFVVDVNLTGTFLTVKHAALAMRETGGAIVAVSSIAGVLSHRLMAGYCASKAGVEMLVKVAADELGALGIRVNAVRPGLIPTDLAAPLLDVEEVVADYRAQQPLAGMGTPEDVAAAVRWLVGPESRWTTGQCLAVDGGHTLRRGPNVDAMMERFLGPDALTALRPRR